MRNSLPPGDPQKPRQKPAKTLGTKISSPAFVQDAPHSCHPPGAPAHPGCCSLVQRRHWGRPRGRAGIAASPAAPPPTGGTAHRQAHFQESVSPEGLLCCSRTATVEGKVTGRKRATEHKLGQHTVIFFVRAFGCESRQLKWGPCAAVDELGGAAGRAAAEVARLQQQRLEPPSGAVQCYSGPCWERATSRSRATPSSSLRGKPGCMGSHEGGSGPPNRNTEGGMGRTSPPTSKLKGGAEKFFGFMNRQKNGHQPKFVKNP